MSVYYYARSTCTDRIVTCSFVLASPTTRYIGLRTIQRPLLFLKLNSGTKYLLPTPNAVEVFFKSFFASAIKEFDWKMYGFSRTKSIPHSAIFENLPKCDRYLAIQTLIFALKFAERFIYKTYT